MVEGLAVPPPKLMVIHGTLLAADFRQLAGVPVMVNVPLLAPAAANAPVLLRVTDVQVCARAGRQKSSANRTLRNVINRGKPQSRFQVAAGLSTLPENRR